MTAATNVDATAVNTIGWLADPETTIVVPVYQRQYRWDIGGCEQLLADVRAVAGTNDGHTHFIGSILSSASPVEHDDARLVLIDGQQRITTLMLLIAALHHTLRASDPHLAADLERVLVRSDDATRTKLTPHRAWADVFESVVLDTASDRVTRESRFDDNYAFFRSQIRPEEAAEIWRGLQKLEHVSITLGNDANAQQIFESLNSTGEPLRDHELIHNYVLMGLSHASQTEIEDEYWLPIERNTSDAIGSFWRHYLVMRTGREIPATSGRGVYDVFRQEFPRLDEADLPDLATEWREYSRIYAMLLNPGRADNPTVAREFAHLSPFGRAGFPLAMRLYRDHAGGVLSESQFIAACEQLQSLLLRRKIVGMAGEHLIARLCRAYHDGLDDLVRAMSRIMPSDQRVRVALKYNELPHAAFVLGRMAGVEDVTAFDVDHIVPVTPGDDWSGDGSRRWADYSEDEQNSHRALAATLGNLVLLERPLADRVFDASYPAKRAAYTESAVEPTRAAAAFAAWSTAAISERSEALTARFVEVWQRPAVIGIDDDNLTPILDGRIRRGWPVGWHREFDYVEYRGEHWEVKDIKYLFNRVFKRLWADSRESVVRFSESRGGPVYPSMAWNGQWDEIGDGQFLYMGWDAKYMLTAVQGVLEEAGIASEVFLRYSYIGDAMALS